MALDWDILNEDFANISAWTDGSTGGGVASSVTYDSKSCLKLDFPTDATGDGSIALVYQEGLSIPATCTIEMKSLFALDETTYGYYVRMEDGSSDYNAFRMGRSGTDGGGTRHSLVGLNDGTSYNYQLTGIADAYLNNWITYRYVIKASRLCDVYANNVHYAFDLTSVDTAVRNRISIYTAANTNERATLYVDYIKIDTTPEGIQTSALQIGDQDIICSYAHDGTPSGVVAANNSKLRMYNKDIGGNACVCSVPLVATGHALASKIRIYDGSAVKALKKVN